jgi:hypothetical protein
MFNGLQYEGKVPLQVVDFSPVITILHEFSGHFSAIHGWFLAGYVKNGVYLNRGRQSLHPLLGNRQGDPDFFARSGEVRRRQARQAKETR